MGFFHSQYNTTRSILQHQNDVDCENTFYILCKNLTQVVFSYDEYYYYRDVAFLQYPTISSTRNTPTIIMPNEEADGMLSEDEGDFAIQTKTTR